MLTLIERAARTCYKSEDRITGQSAPKFVKMLLDRGHHAMLEFGFICVRFVCDRGVSHELVRHRLCAFAQESTRYCDYSGGGILVVRPPEIRGDALLDAWEDAILTSQEAYDALRREGATPQIARAVLPTCLKTEIVVGANPREWRHIFTLRTAKTAHPQMRELMVPLLAEMKQLVPVLFDDIDPETEANS